jgi:hypothetical protein
MYSKRLNSVLSDRRSRELPEYDGMKGGIVINTTTYTATRLYST